MPSEGKVGSLFVEFRTNLNQLLSDFQKMTDGVRAVSASVANVQKQFTDLGHLGSSALSEVVNDFGGLTSGLSTVNNYTQQVSKSFSDLGHIGSAAVVQINNDLASLAAGLSTANTFTRQASQGVSNLGHLGGAGITEAVNDIGGLASGLSTVNTFARQASGGLGDIGHLGSPAIRQVSNDLGGLTAGLNVANTFTREASEGVSNLGHLGGAAMNTAAVATATFGDRIRQASTEIRQFDRIFAPIRQRLNDIGFALTAGLTVPLLAVGAFSLKVGKDFETAFSGVRQVLNATEPELATLRQQLIDLSTAAPTTAVKFAEIATTAAKLGVETPNIEKFATTINQLGTITNLSGEAAANFLARFTNLTHLDPGRIGDLGDTLFALGKAFPAVETEIANFALRVAKTGTFVGLSSGEILAFATALASVGVSAESGGTAISRVLAEMAKASENLNGARLAEFAAVAKKSAGDFATEFKTNAAGAVLDFVRGLQRIKAEGGDVFTTLDALKLSNVRTRETLLALALGSDQLTRALVIQGNQTQNTADATRAYGEKVKTTEAQLAIFENQVKALGISLFDAFAPTINGVVLPALKRLVDEGIKPALKAFEDMSPAGQHVTEVMLLIAAATGPAILAITKLVSFVEGLIIIFERLSTAEAVEGMAKLASAATRLVEPLTVVGAVIAGWELEKVVIQSLGLQKQFDETKTSAANLAEAVGNLAGALGRLTINALIADFKNLKTVMDGLAGPFKEIAIAAILPQIVNSGIQINALAGYLNGLSKALDDSGKSGRGFSDALSAAMQPVAGFSDSLSALMQKFSQGNKTIVPDISSSTGPNAEDLAAQGKALEALRKEHEKLLVKFKEELAPADALNKELSYLQQYFSNDELISAYGKKIVDATEAQWNHHKAVSGTVGVLYEQAKALETVQERLKELNKDQKEVPTFNAQIAGGFPGLQTPTSPLEGKALKGFEEARQQIDDLALALKNLSFLGPAGEIELFNTDISNAEKFAKAFGFSLDPVIIELIKQKKVLDENVASTKAWEEASNKGLKTADDMASQVATTVEAVRRMADAGFADATILDILGKTIEDAAENARILGVQLDPVIAMLAKMREEMKGTAKEAKEFDREIARITAKIANDLASGIADALLGGSKSFGEVAVKIAKDFAAAFIRAVITELIAPLVKQFEELGKAIAANLAKAIASHPVVAAIAAVVLAVVAIVKTLSDSHIFASQFVKETQNPFAKSLSQFLDTSNKLYEAGRQTYQGAQDAEVKVRELWQGFLDDAAKFGEQGRKQATVAQQAIETLSPTFRRVIFDIQAQIESLKPPSVRAVESVNALAAFRAQVSANTDEHIAELRAEATAIDDQIKEVQKQIDAQQELGGSTAELNAQMQELIYQWDAVLDALDPLLPKLYTFAEAVKSVSENLVPDKTLEFLDQVLNATSGSANLEEALGVLEQIGTPIGIIIDRLGGDIENFANALELSGVPIPPLIEKYLKLKQASEAAVTDIPKIANSFSKLVGQFVDKVRSYVNGDSDLTNGIIDAIGTLLNKIPNPATASKIVATVDADVRDAVDKVRVVNEGMLATLKNINSSVGLAATSDLIAGGPPSAADFAVTPQPAITQVTIRIEDNEVITNEFNFTAVITRQEVRDNVIPEITEVLTNNTDSVTEKWIRRLSGAKMVKI